ncbi:MAG: hypothetical protein IPM50_02410 [Acidobacteriota bacterium]|nr:MAG: hypothetical protein IPM50_02410 [Acidobacteriota bacterium]
MNVFQDLVEELKEENLLEETVIETEAGAASNRAGKSAKMDVIDEAVTEDLGSAEDHSFGPDNEAVETTPDKSETEHIEGLERHGDPTAQAPAANLAGAEKPLDAKEPPKKRDKEFFQKRASSEVSSLQMVDHILAGIEREYLKVIPKPFDDFNVKKTLNIFLQSSEGVDSEKYLAAEFNLLQETEAWCTALAERDKAIRVASLRQFVDNSRPVLSSQAMLALARFYRNLPHTEDVRAKFDFIITRLFSKSIGMERRSCLFNREEMLGHINTLYEEWASVPLYAADEDDESKLLLTALSFADLAEEAENAATFDQLLKNEFFERLRMFKESISDLFYAPNVTAAAIEANVRIGNAYVSLIEREKDKMDAEALESKYADHDHDAISEAAARTLHLVDVLKAGSAKEEETESEAPEIIERFEDESPQTNEAEAPISLGSRLSMPKFASNLLENAFEVNKWLLVLSALLIAGAVGVYIWGNYVVREDVSTAGVAPISIQNAQLAEQVRVAKLSGENLYLQMNPSWDAFPKEKRQEYLQRMMQEGSAIGFKQVTLINSNGKYAGFASASRIDVVMP